MPQLSVIVPVFNEEGNLKLLYERLTNTCKEICNDDYELVFVNDGSKDSSIAILKSLSSLDNHVQYIDLSKNFGHQNAVYAGMENCRGEAVVIIDADMQDPPELIKELYAKYKEGFDVVYAQRLERAGEKWHKLMTAKAFYRLVNFLSEVHIPLDTGDFRIISKRVCKIVCEMPERNKFLRGQIAWTGFNQTYITYNRDIRYSGNTKYSYSKMFRFAFDGITSFTNIPLKLATWLGFLVAGIAVFMFFYTIYIRLFSDDFVKGWPSLMVAVLFIGGVQLICIGILGEYLGRILDNVRHRPLYLIKESSFKENHQSY